MLTTAVILYLLHLGVAIKKWVDSKIHQGYGLIVSGTLVACACGKDVARLFMQKPPSYAITLLEPTLHEYYGVTAERFHPNLTWRVTLQAFNFLDAIE